MFDAKRDNNQVTTLIGVSSVDGITPVTVYVDPVTHRVLVQGATGGGTVTSVATDSTLTGGPITTTGTLGLNLGNANTWTATQTFSNNSSIQVLANGAPGGGTIGKGPGNELEISSWNQSSFSNISIRAQSGSPGYQLYLGTNGNIGVGTATPGSALQVNGGVVIGYSTSQTAPTNGLIVLGHLILEGVTSTGATGTGNLVFGTSPTVTLASASTAVTQSPSDGSTKIATTAYVDAAVLGQNFKEAAVVATTANLVGVYVNGSSGVGATFTYTATGVDVIDGVTLALGNRVLLKNQTSTFQNGIYTVTTAGAIGVAGVLTRATDANQSNEYKTGDSLFITSGTTQSATTWAYTGINSPTMGTDALTYVQTAGQGSFTAGNGIAITGNSIAIDTSITVDKTTAQTLSNKTLTSPIISSISNTGTLTLPTSTDNLVGRNTIDTLANKTLTTPVINGLPTGTGVASAATASTLVSRDTNANTTINNLLEGYTTTATAAGTTTLTVSSTYQQFFTGTTTQTVVLPVTSTLVLGQQYIITNNSTGNVTVQSSGGNTITVIPTMQSAVFTVILTSGTTAASWSSNAPFTGSTATTFTFDGAGGTSSSVTIQMQRIGNFVTMYIPVVTATTGTGSVGLTSNTAIPATFRPTTNPNVPVTIIMNNGANVDNALGILVITNAGFLTFYRAASAPAFANSATAGSNAAMVATYYIV